MKYTQPMFCRDHNCPFKDNCKRYKTLTTASYFLVSPRVKVAEYATGEPSYVCEMYDSKKHIAPEGVKK